jgi:hypothetical protein
VGLLLNHCTSNRSRKEKGNEGKEHLLIGWQGGKKRTNKGRNNILGVSGGGEHPQTRPSPWSRKVREITIFVTQ